MKFPERNSGNSKDILRTKDGDRFTGVFRGEVLDYFQHWNGRYSDVCTKYKPGGCKQCEAGEKASYRIRVNFYVQIDGQWTVKIFEAGSKVLKRLKQLNEDSPLEHTLVRISVSGHKTDKETFIDRAPGDALVKPELDKTLKAIPLLDLSPEQDEAEEEQGTFAEEMG